MNRRFFLRLIAAGVIGHELDLDKLLWLPGQKKIFIPTEAEAALSMSQIIALEYERILPHIRDLFERDDTFYRILNKEKL